MTLTPPQPLKADHEIKSFESGQLSLDEWLNRYAMKNEESGASRTYVVCNGNDVVGYYCLSSGSIESKQAPRKIRRNMPDPIPIMLMGRLAVDKSWQQKGLGRGLVRDAILRTLNAAEIAGIRVLLVHALDEEAAAFYEHIGFLASPINSLILMLPLTTALKALE